MNSKLLRKDASLSQKEFDEAILSLIEKGLVEKITLNDKEEYRLTEIGNLVGKHIGSDPSLRN